MKKLYKFEAGEITIKKENADILRERILEIARNNEISTEPIQYERIFLDIQNKMIELADEYQFLFEGKEYDFTTANPIMFTSKVLKDFLSRKKEYEMVTLQRKNLDILSFYAFNIPYKELCKQIQKQNCKDEQESKHSKNNQIDETINNNNNTEILYLKNNKDVMPRKKLYHRFITISLFILLILVLIFFIFKYLKLSQLFEEREIKYTSAIQNLTIKVKDFSNFNILYYDTLIIPHGNYLARIVFDDDKITYMPFPCKYEVITSDSGASIISEPGIKYCEQFNKSKAFGFGKRNCISGCYKPIELIPYDQQPNSTILRIKFDKPHYLKFISLQWIEIGRNWGSVGFVYINGKKKGEDPYQTIGNWPTSNMLIDEQVRNYKAYINDYSYQIDIVVLDITNESEIFINDIKIWGD